MSMKDDSQLQELVTSVATGKLTVEAAVNELVSDAGLKVGTSVAVLADPTYPFDGQKGKIVAMSEQGYADVKFDNGTTVPLQVSLLVAV